MTSVRILAPAKVNLGLAILGRREDGYHEIDTIMAMVDLCDEITISPSGQPGISIDGMDDVPIESNLMTKGARLWSEAAGVDPSFHLEITKRIPSAAGIGGGSSDAVAVLKALNALHKQPLGAMQLHDLATRIGADCPFFLQGPVARATGIGTEIRNITSPSGWMVLVVPRIEISSKTAQLYGALTPADFGSSESIDAIERDGGTQTSLPNSFLRPALEIFPGLDDLYQQMLNVAGNASLSGAGPTLYSIAISQEEASRWADQIEELLPLEADVLVTSFLGNKPQPDLIP